MTTFRDRSPRVFGLPWDKWRTGQVEAVERILAAPPGLVFVDAPTGSGKSGVAFAAASRSGVRSVITTKTHQLQDQYTREFPGLTDLRGLGTYGCSRGYHDAAICSLVGNRCATTCPSGIAHSRAAAARLLLTNHDYLALTWPRRGRESAPLHGRELVLVDEGHLFEESLRAAGDVEFSTEALLLATELGVDPPQGLDRAAWAAWAAEVGPTAESALKDADLTDPAVAEDYQPHHALADAAARARLALGHGREVSIAWDGGLAIRPLFGHAAPYAGTKLVLLSATLPDPDLLLRMLGVSDYTLVTVPPTFPADRRPFWIAPSVRVQRSMTGADLDQLVEDIDGYIDYWWDRKGIIHTHAYWLQDAILSRTRHAGRLITHRRRGLGRAVQDFEQSGPGTWLVSPTAHSGVDLPYDHVRAQLIAKLPTPSLGDDLVQARREAMPETYDLAIAQTIQQAYGRGMRAPDDHCDTVMLDGNWRWWWPKNKHLFRPWFIEAVR